MQEFLIQHYLLFKVLHIIFVICWMAAMFYAPRLFVYHAGCVLESDAYSMLLTMERKLITYIMHPSMVIAVASGLILSLPYWEFGWMHAKSLAVLLLVAMHVAIFHYYKCFRRNANKKNSKFFRIFNEIPPLLMIAIVYLVVVQPF